MLVWCKAGVLLELLYVTLHRGRTQNVTYSLPRIAPMLSTRSLYVAVLHNVTNPFSCCLITEFKALSLIKARVLYVLLAHTFLSNNASSYLKLSFLSFFSGAFGMKTFTKCAYYARCSLLSVVCSVCSLVTTRERPNGS